MNGGTVILAIVMIAAAYLIGGIPWGILIARLIGGPDPRSLGSGRTGGANTMRAIGPRAALVAGLLDAAKGSVSVLLAIWLGLPPIVQAAAGLAAIVGHSRSPYIGFRGGRGVAPGWGALLVIEPVVALGVLPVFLIVLLVTRISSLASLATSVAAAVGLIVAVIMGAVPAAFLLYAFGGLALIWLFHADNIHRLLTGQERRVEFRGQR
jgi:glycerol-3-phosphate acyltransferase PlsY